MKVKCFEYNVISQKECKNGSLVALEETKNIPFKIKRVFYIYGVDTSISRGAHAHKESNQILIAVNGSCEISFCDGIAKQKVHLSSKNQGVLQESMIWGEMHNFSKDCILMVLSDSFYDENDYIRDYSEFLELCRVVL